MSQIPLPLAYRSADGESDFYISPANADAVAQLDRWPDWPQRTLVLTGPEGAGKSHLVRIFARRVGAEVEVIDPADAGLDEEAVFHAWNAAQAGGKGLLLVGRRPSAKWGIKLPDLNSRLASAAIAKIAAPDDALLCELVAKHFRDRGLIVSPNILSYMIARIERSFAGAAEAVARVDDAAMAERRAVTIPLVRAVLDMDAVENESVGSQDE